MRLSSLVLLCVLLGAGCDPRRPADRSRPSGAGAARVGAADPSTDVPNPNALPEVPPPEAFPPPLPSPDPQDERRTNDALAAAADSAEHAASGSDDCESAHNQLLAMYGTVERELGGTMHRPERADFLAICREMPSPARRCIVPTYAMEHQEDCTAALEAVPEDVRQRFGVVMNGPGSD